MQNGQGNQPPARVFSEMVPPSMAAALLFLSLFWSMRHPGTPQAFAIVAAVFAIPQLFFPFTWRVLRSPYVLIITGGLIALSCIFGSLFSAPFAQVYVYSAPWFLVFCWYFSLGCLASGLIFTRTSRFAPAALHLSFVLIAGGFALDGFLAAEGVFRTTMKTAPGVMPPAYGHFAPGESSDTYITDRRDPGSPLPFTLKLNSFDVEFETLLRVAVTPGIEASAGQCRFKIMGYAVGEGDKLVQDVNAQDLDSALIVLQVVMKGVENTAAIPFDGGDFGPFNAEVSYEADPAGGRITDIMINIVQKVPKHYTSVVDVVVEGETVIKDAVIEVNKPLRFEGWSIYQADWGRYVSLDEWESLPGNMRSERQFEQYIKKNEIPPTSMFTISRRPGKWLVYLGYILMCAFSLALLAMPRNPSNGGNS
ncbi:MAG: cytochrome c biogenesis protein ResB [Candidatus Brocadiia bacterium]